MESGRKKRTVLTLQQKKEILVCLDQGELQATLAKKFGVDKSTICYIKKNADQIRRYVQSRTLELYPKLGGTRDFRASNGWLQKFKSRHGIRELEVQGESLSSDAEAAGQFVIKFRAALNIGTFDPEFIYNGDETGLYYRALPSRSLAARNERSAPGRKASKDRVTVMTCANATAVEEHQKIIGKEGNVLLILDNAPSHPPLTTMETKNGKFTVTFLPPNVTAILQPMDQGVIVALNRLYRKQLMFRMLCLIENDAAAASGNLSKLIDLKDCCLMLSQAWASVRTSTSRNAWNKLMPIGFGGEPASWTIRLKSQFSGRTCDKIQDSPNATRLT
ncbi:jerky protein homolog-like [Galendromus occidentalis]|uniref:Jerky protein homolog-like n=1 Tax=Galendromus occidentalis TaxID=34638 RepID=A0AAJ7SCT1_9ACAR|nr:jerky protein homolog-like [Galendromus occidentalis]